MHEKKKLNASSENRNKPLEVGGDKPTPKQHLLA